VLTADAQLEFRRTVGMFATGVAVLSCIDPDVDCADVGYAVHGATINSFTSVSTKPPTVMVSLMAGRAHQFITGNGHFGASVLHADQQPCSDYFAGKRYADPPVFAVRDRVPTLVDCLAWFECEVMQRFDVHDHTVFVARVLSCGNNAGSPLLFHASRYHRPDLTVSTT